MTKAEIVQVVYARVAGFSKRETTAPVDATFEIMKEALGQGEKVKVSGFGKFNLRDKHARPGRDPQTGEAITIEERRVVSFKASLLLRGRLNGGDGRAEDVVADERRAGGVAGRR